MYPCPSFAYYHRVLCNMNYSKLGNVTWRFPYLYGRFVHRIWLWGA